MKVFLIHISLVICSAEAQAKTNHEAQPMRDNPDLTNEDVANQSKLTPKTFRL